MEKSPLSALPPELRNAIYEMALLHSERIRIYDETAEGFPDVMLWRAPPLLATCRAVRQEACPIYYGRNIFQVSAKLPTIDRREERSDKCDVELADWLARIGGENRSLLRKVYLDDNLYEPEEVDARVTACRELLAFEDVEIDHARLYVKCDLEEGDDSEDEGEEDDSEDEEEDDDSDEEDERYKWISSSDSLT